LNRNELWAGWLMVLPAMAGLLFFLLMPFLFALGISFTNLRLGSPLPLEWVGLEQYRRILLDPTFRQALQNNLYFAAVVVPLQTGLALLLALWLNRPLSAMPVFRTFFFMPVIFPLSLVSVIWVLIYAPGQGGPLNAFLEWISFGHWTARDFLHDPQLALPAIMLTSLWQGVGFQMVVLLAGLQAIPKTLYEAAAIDGAGRFSQFLHVTLPQMRNSLIFVVIVTSILSFRVFDQVRIMTFGGPNDASVTVIFEAVRSGFDQSQVARGSAMGLTFFLIVACLTLIQRRLLRQQRG
jgi:multiple sugar transport system permease protein